MTLREIAREYRGAIGPEDFDILAAFALKTSKEYIIREPDHTLSGTEEMSFRDALDRRATHEPVALITGEKEFFGLPFIVTRDTLIPRPETEHLVEEALALLLRHDDRTITIDLGTGSGAIIVSLAHTLRGQDTEPESHTFIATDISPAALDVAKQNAKNNNVEDHLDFFEGSLLDPVPKTVFSDADRLLILANLPYLSREMYENTDEDVRLYEPESALVAEKDGLSLYIELLNDIAQKKESGWKKIRIDGLFEISPEQESSLKKIFLDRFPSSRNDFLPDLSGRTRILRFQIR